MTEVTEAPTPWDWVWSELFMECVCVLALADKLMEETEELCLQREQREVGAHEGHSESLHFPTTPDSGGPGQPRCTARFLA